jgi:hypothetical protein
MQLLNKYRENAEKINLLLFWILVTMNILDISLTYYGVTILGRWGEGNPLFKQAIESGKYFFPILFKTIPLILLGMLLFYVHKRINKAEMPVAKTAILSGIIGLVLIIGNIIFIRVVGDWAISIFRYLFIS